MATRKLKPVHPGQVLKHDFMDPLGVTAYRLSKETGVTQVQWGRIIHGRRAITPETALCLARFFGTSAGLWINLQARYDLDVVEDAKGAEIAARIKPWSEGRHVATA